MKKINNSILKGFNALIVALLTLLGFSNCGYEDMYGPPPVEYGVPYADYVVKGKVTNKADKKPIPNIRVGFSPVRFESMYGVQQTNYQDMPYVQTDENGNYVLKIAFAPKEEIDSLFVYDIDGVENGGEFTADTIAIDWSKAQKTKKASGNWYKGELTSTQNIELTEDK